MYPSTCFQKNLRIPETGVNFSLNLFLNKLKLINILKPEEYDNSCNLHLLMKYDKSKETLGKISFLPLEFLELYLINKEYIKQPLQITDQIELKKQYIKIFIDLKLFNEKFFRETLYKNIPLYYFRKQYLSADLSKTIDVSLIDDIEEEEEEEKTINYLNLTNILYKTFKIKDVKIKNQNEWLHKNDLINLIIPKILSLKDNIKDSVCFLPFLYLKNPLYNIDYTYSDIINSINLQDFDFSKRYIIFIILYKSHFTSVIIDNNLETKNNGKKKVAFFFNSCGYNPNNFNYNKNYWFIDNSSKINNFKMLNIKYNNKNNNYMPIEALTLILKDKFAISNFVFNTYSIQNFDSECGIYSSMFLFFFLDMINNKKNIDILSYKYLYFNMINLGFDLTYSMIRGLLFFTHEDTVLNNINDNIYKKSPFIYEIKNKKFKDYLKIYYKNLLNFEKIYNDIKIDIKNILLKYKTFIK